ncbi:MAG: hypothetical protein WB987_15240 [Candidatus Acidiferrales bacterium]
MKIARMVAALVLGLALSTAAVAQPVVGSGPSKWFHHEKKNPNRKKVHHAKPAHRAATKHKAHKHG